MPRDPRERHSGRMDQEIRRQMARFLFVGSASVAVDLAVYTLLTTMVSRNWALSKGLSYACGIMVGFFGNKFWTFRSRRRSVTEPARYLLLYALTLLLNIGCNHLALLAMGGEMKFIAFLLATGVTMVANFFGMQQFAFRRGIAERNRIQKIDGGRRNDPQQLRPGAPHSTLRTESTDSQRTDS